MSVSVLDSLLGMLRYCDGLEREFVLGVVRRAVSLCIANETAASIEEKARMLAKIFVSVTLMSLN